MKEVITAIITVGTIWVICGAADCILTGRVNLRALISLLVIALGAYVLGYWCARRHG